mmetsp:Transcript_43788/g.121205  ORF Transcript_43788/g.121205 Transcript_43788/m.121205 type:complete len:277 (-) Transcript_43788:286-1116(-)
MSLAAAWSCDSSAQAQVTKMLSFFDSGGGASGVKTGYTLSGGSLGGQDQGCFLAMASTLYVHSTDDSNRAAAWRALTASDPSDYFCDSLRMVAILYSSGLMTPTYASPPPPGPPPSPSPQVPYTCTSGQCVQASSGSFANSSTCHASCFARYACNQTSQTCSISSYGAYAGKDACLSVCRTAACSNTPYAQCGGVTWKGNTCCPDGYTCSGSGYYYQCVPSSSSSVSSADRVGGGGVLLGGGHTGGFRPRYTNSSGEAPPREQRFTYHSARPLPSI